MVLIQKNIIYIFVPIIILFLWSIFFTPVVDAGILTATRTEGTGGTTFSINWRQGCSSASLLSLGPNACFTDNRKPWYCPIGSTGGNQYVRRCGEIVGGVQVTRCGCNANSACNFDNGFCIACLDPCASRCLEPYLSCSVIGDWCDDNAVCNCDITTEAEGCAQFMSCGGGETCEYTGGSGGDRCDASNYRCVSSGPPCSCSGVHVCWWEKDDGSGDNCVPVSTSTSCEVMASCSIIGGNWVCNSLFCGIPDHDLRDCTNPPSGCQLRSISSCSSSPSGSCCSAQDYMDGVCAWP